MTLVLVALMFCILLILNCICIWIIKVILLAGWISLILFLWHKRLILSFILIYGWNTWSIREERWLWLLRLQLLLLILIRESWCLTLVQILFLLLSKMSLKLLILNWDLLIVHLLGVLLLLLWLLTLGSSVSFGVELSRVILQEHVISMDAHLNIFKEPNFLVLE